MQSAEESLRLQSGGKGYFAQVQLEVEPAKESNRVRIDVTPQCPESWKAAAEFGVYYAWDLMSPRQGVDVRVVAVDGYPADTTALVVAFVTARAFLKAMSVPSPIDLRCDPRTGHFVFPKFSSDDLELR